MFIRGVIVWFFIFLICAAFIFGYRYITKEDVKISGKLIAAGILSGIFSFGIYILESGTIL